MSVQIDLLCNIIDLLKDIKQLLQEQLNIVRKMKPKIVEDTNREVELFRRFREFSKTNPDITYETFIKQMNT